jgi:hypothetical protein
VSGLEVVELLTLQGKHDEAVDEFVRLVDGGWRFYWWSVTQDPALLRPIQDDPEFIAAVDRLKDNVAAEWAWYEANKAQAVSGTAVN